MKNIPKISESEFEIMKILWKKSPLYANEIMERLKDKVTWSPQTVKTFLNRLLKKQVIKFEKSGRNYLYYPLFSYNDYVKVENQSFLQRVYDGAVGMLFSKFLEEEDLSQSEIDHLQKILEEKKTYKK